MREIHNLVKHGETAKRGTLGGHSHARGDLSNYDMFRSLISCFFWCIPNWRVYPITQTCILFTFIHYIFFVCPFFLSEF